MSLNMPEHGLTLLKIVNDLDITLNLKNGSFRPYHKPDDQMQYIRTESNHPPNIIQQIPLSKLTIKPILRK